MIRFFWMKMWKYSVIYYHMLKKLNLPQKKSKVLKKETSTKTEFIGIVFDYFNRDAKSKMEI